MDVLLQQFLRRHRTAIYDIVEQHALMASVDFTQLAPDVRRQQCEYYTDVIVQAIVQGYIERPTSQQVVSTMGAVGVPVGEVLIRAAWIEVALEDYIREALAGEADACADVLRRLRHAYSSFVTKLTAVQFAQPHDRPGRPQGPQRGANLHA